MLSFLKVQTHAAGVCPEATVKVEQVCLRVFPLQNIVHTDFEDFQKQYKSFI